MFSRPPILLLCLSILFFGALTSMALSQASTKHVEQESSGPQTEEQVFKAFIDSASIILIAEVLDMPPASKKLEDITPPNRSINLQKELDRAREETAQTYTGLNVGSLIRLKTIETLKGPKTQILQLPNSDLDFKDAEIGDLFIIMMGVDHPDAIKAVPSMEDPWVTRVKAAIAN